MVGLRSVWFVLVVAALGAACGDNGGGNDADAGVDGGGGGADAPVPDPPDGGPDSGPGGHVDAGTPTIVDFATSFETGEPQPAWTSTVDTEGKGAAGVTGPVPSLLGSIMDDVTGVSASGENPPGEVAGSIADGDLTTKWLVFASTGWVRIDLQRAIAVRRYAVSSANDAPGRDPRTWTLEGSADGTSWDVVDTRTDQTFSGRFVTRVFDVANTTAYQHYRLNVTANAGDGILQIAELHLSDGDDTPPGETPMKTAVGRGPGGSWNAKLSAGFTGVRALRYAGSLAGAGRGYSYNKVFEVDIPVTVDTELSYLIFADEAAADPAYPGTFAAVDLAFTDGTFLSDLDAVDQHFATLSPAGQGASRTLYAGEWNRKVARIGAVAAGKTIARIVVGYENPTGPAPSFGGWIDDIAITRAPVEGPRAHLSDYAITTRGTNSSGGYSRGNNFPATAVPHGFNFWTPVTDAGSDSWLYVYHRSNDASNLPMLQALSLSHETSPWMGDRQSFQVMPSLSATPDADRGRRALAFRHANEIARPYHYRVAFENGITAELAPTDHAAMFRFSFPGDDASLIFDNIDDRGGLTLDPATGSLTGFCDARSGLSAGATRIFVYATFDKPVVASGRLTGGGGSAVAGYYRFGVAAADRTVTMRIASSLISVEQARKNLALEIAAGDSFEAVKDRARALWDAKLGIVEVEGANLDQLTTLYSNLYRLFLYPNSGFENTGTAEAPVYQYASPVSPPTGANTPGRTGARIVDGKLYVNNGFWDTYRTAWPAYSLLTPTQAGEMIDGFVQQYRDGGWVSRWSSPGYADLMTGTSSDVAFADAYLKGVRFDAAAAYDAAVRNATAMPTSNAVGRKGLELSSFLGYTPTETGAGLSWAMAGYLNDFGIANLAAALGEVAGPRQQEYREDAAYFLARSLGYTNLFDPAIGFFQGRNRAGAFRVAPAAYDPAVWGFDYTETNGWNMAFDAPHDGQGLANLLGGRAALGAKLDAFFATPETGTLGGSYGGVIHEMREARDVRMGMLGLSNQPSFHIMYMYAYAGEPAKTQAKVRDALGRLFVGSEIGQGFLGDEDNGATASWQIFSALGFYPLQVGSPTYVIGSPLFTRATVHLENGKDLVISAPGNGPRNVYVQSVTVDGAPYGKTYLPHALLAGGATIELTMGPAPSAWGTGPDDVPPSITAVGAAPAPLRDVATGAVVSGDAPSVAGLFDDSSATSVTFGAANPAVQVQLAAPARATFYTITSGIGTGDPTGWTLAGSTDGAAWTTLDQRTTTFPWRRQTRAFQIATPGTYTHYRLTLTGTAGRSLAELELLVP
jgi:predicted alpha-1,2-mannosidase